MYLGGLTTVPLCCANVAAVYYNAMHLLISSTKTSMQLEDFFVNGGGAFVQSTVTFCNVNYTVMV